jgi:MoaA/NifB/PqqE/SkfB family radical SAM enzyme
MPQLASALSHLSRPSASGLLELAVRVPATRNRLLTWGDRRLRRFFLEENQEGLPLGIQRLRYQAITNLLAAFSRAAGDGRLCSNVRRRFIATFIDQVVSGEQDRQRPFVEAHGQRPPSFLVVSPTRKCNLSCKGCYAACNRRTDNTLPYEVLQRMLDEKREVWGSHFNVISGGEPLLYESQGRTLFDLLENNSDDYFMIYTNGTLIDRDVASRLASLGNASPAISVEGWEKETDARRGRGVYRKIQQAMECLREAGVPFGISITATRQNAETVLSSEFIDHYQRRAGAIYAWLFQYMPIGRSYTVDLMVTPEQRLWMLERQLELIRREKLFVIDFWNGGPMSVGCIAAGRGGGYFYVDWDGNLAPCVFFPYHVENICDLYARGENLTSALQSRYFRTIRGWQEVHMGTRGGGAPHDLFTPCPIRDHYNVAWRTIQTCGAQPMDEDAATALEDPEYRRRMRAYGERVAALLDPVWEQEMGLPAGGRRRSACACGESSHEPRGERIGAEGGPEAQNRRMAGQA